MEKKPSKTNESIFNVSMEKKASEHSIVTPMINITVGQNGPTQNQTSMRLQSRLFGNISSHNSEQQELDNNFEQSSYGHNQYATPIQPYKNETLNPRINQQDQIYKSGINMHRKSVINKVSQTNYKQRGRKLFTVFGPKMSSSSSDNNRKISLEKKNILLNQRLQTQAINLEDTYYKQANVNTNATRPCTGQAITYIRQSSLTSNGESEGSISYRSAISGSPGRIFAKVRPTSNSKTFIEQASLSKISCPQPINLKVQNQISQLSRNMKLPKHAFNTVQDEPIRMTPTTATLTMRLKQQTQQKIEVTQKKNQTPKKAVNFSEQKDVEKDKSNYSSVVSLSTKTPTANKEKKPCSESNCIPPEILYQLSKKIRYIGDDQEEDQIPKQKILSIQDKTFWKKYEKLRKKCIFDGKITLLQYHKYNYGQAKERMCRERCNPKISFLQAEIKMQRLGIEAYKYNYSFDKEVQLENNYQATIYLSQDHQSLKIMNKKIIPQEEYILEPDYIEANFVKNEWHENPKETKYRETQCSGSCNLSDVKGILYGGISSRFWLLRKHLILLDRCKHTCGHVPFYSWQCITLQMENRDVDLVIKNEKDMDDFIKIVVRAMNTVDGNKNSGDVIKNQLLTFKNDNKQEMTKQDYNVDDKLYVTEKEQYQILRSTCLKYKVMRLRCKIGFEAFVQNMTIPELFITKILNTFSDLNNLNEIKRPFEQIVVNDQEIFEQIMERSISHVLRQLIRSNNEIILIKEFIDNQVDKDNAIHNLYHQRKQMLAAKEEGLNPELTESKYHNTLSLINQIQLLNDGGDLFDPDYNDKDKNACKEDQIGRNYSKDLQFKKIRNQKRLLYEKIKFVVNLKATRTSVILMLKLNKIRLAKEIFVIDIEKGGEVFIPVELNQGDIGRSFRFYDSLVMIVQNQLSDNVKDLNAFKNTYRIGYLANERFDTKILQFLGIIDEQNGNKQPKLTLKHTLVNSQKSKDIDHHLTPHVLGIQRSRYLMVDDDINRLQKHFTTIAQANQKELQQSEIINNGGARVNNQQLAIQGQKYKSQQISLRFCQEAEVNQKRQKNLTDKSCFLAKLKHLIIIGDKNTLTMRTEQFIDQNLDQLYESKKIHEQLEKHCNSLHGKCKSDKEKQPCYTKEVVQSLRAKNNEYYRKRHFKENLLDYFESKLIERNKKMRNKAIAKIKERTHRSVDYRPKVEFIEAGITHNMAYFKKSAKGYVKIMEDINTIMQNVDPSLHLQENGNLIKKYKTQELDILKCKIDENERIIYDTKQQIIRNRMKLNKMNAKAQIQTIDNKKEVLESTSSQCLQESLAPTANPHDLIQKDNEYSDEDPEDGNVSQKIERHETYRNYYNKINQNNQ